MSFFVRLALVACLLGCQSIHAQAFRVESWTSSDGRKLDAVFVRLTDNANQVQLGIPQTVRADLLSEATLAEIVRVVNQQSVSTTKMPIKLVSRVGSRMEALVDEFNIELQQVEILKLVSIPLARLNERSAGHARNLQEQLDAKERASTPWAKELREVGPMISMSYKIKDKFFGMRVTSPEYEAKLKKLAAKEYQSDIFRRMIPAMIHLAAEMARMKRIEVGLENPTLLTAQEVQARLQSMSDAFEAGVTGSDDAVHRVLDHAFVEIERLYRNKLFAEAGTTSLSAVLVEFWESVLDGCRSNAAPQSDKLKVEVLYNYQGVGLSGAGTGGQLWLKNRSGKSLSNVVIKLESNASSGKGSPTDFYFYVTTLRNNMSIELPPDSFDDLASPVRQPKFDQGAGGMSRAAFRVSIWSNEMHREDMELFESQNQEVVAVPQPGLMGRLPSMQTKSVTVKFTEEK